MALFIRLIIHIFQLVFSTGTVFFSRSKSANRVFSRLISTAEWGHCVCLLAEEKKTACSSGVSLNTYSPLLVLRVLVGWMDG
jgi:hypothetical protein